MSGKEGEGAYKLLLQSVDPENAADISEVIQKLLGVGQGQAKDILDSVPIILLDGIASEEKANLIRKKFEQAERFGARMLVSGEPLEHTPTLRWPEEPDFAKEGEPEKEEGKEDEVFTLVKYNFIVDRRNVFRCPHCDKLFAIKELSLEEAQEAIAQAEIAERLKKPDRPRPAAAPEPAAPPPVAQQAAPGVEEVEPIQDARPQAGVLADTGGEIMDLATFEEGLSSIEYESSEAPELALPPDSQPVSSEEKAQDFFQELESLPVEGGGEEVAVQEPPSAEAAQKESELQELDPEEAMKFFEGRRTTEEDEEEPEEGQKKIMAPRRGAARRRMQKLRDKQEDKGEKRRGSGRRKRVREEPEEEEEPGEEPEHTEGFYGVVLSRVGSREKKKKSAELISELTGLNREEARDMCEGMFVNVIRGISEEEAKEISARFKEFGVSAKVTLQKRKRRQSERMQRRK